MHQYLAALFLAALSPLGFVTGQSASDRTEDPQVKVACTTTAGPFTVTLTPSFSPFGVQRYLDLVEDGFFADMLLYRVIEGFLGSASPRIRTCRPGTKMP